MDSIKLRAYPDKLNREINKQCRENMSFGVAAISEDICLVFNGNDLQR